MSDSDEVEALLARELAGFDFGNRHASSEPIGARIINWRALTDDEAAEAWGRLREWVEWITTRYNIPLSVVPDCWWKHGALVEELSALHIAHQAAFDDSDSGFGPIGWHERFAIAVPRLSRAYGGGCNNGHREAKPRSWEAATDEQEWDTWTTQAHGH